MLQNIKSVKQLIAFGIDKAFLESSKRIRNDFKGMCAPGSMALQWLVDTERDLEEKRKVEFKAKGKNAHLHDLTEAVAAVLRRLGRGTFSGTPAIDGRPGFIQGEIRLARRIGETAWALAVPGRIRILGTDADRAIVELRSDLLEAKHIFQSKFNAESEEVARVRAKLEGHMDTLHIWDGIAEDIEWTDSEFFTSDVTLKVGGEALHVSMDQVESPANLFRRSENRSLQHNPTAAITAPPAAATPPAGPGPLAEKKADRGDETVRTKSNVVRGDDLAEAQSNEPTIYYHGDANYSMDGRTFRPVSQTQHNLLQAFLNTNGYMKTGALQEKSGVENVSKTIKELVAKYGGMYESAIETPNGDKASPGYFIRVQDVSKKV